MQFSQIVFIINIYMCAALILQELSTSDNFCLFRLRLASFDSRGKLVCSRSTGYQLLTLEKDQVREHC